MQAKSSIQPPAPGQGSGLPDPTPAHTLEQARERVKSALHAAEDGDLLPENFDDIVRPLVLALRDLDELTFSLGVMSRSIS